MRVFVTGPDDEGRRLDRILRRLLPAAPLSAIYRALRTGRIRVDDGKASGRRRVQAGETITIPRELDVGAPPVDETGQPARSREENKKGRRESSAPPDSGRPSGMTGPGTPSTGAALEVITTGPHLIAVNKLAGTPTHGPGSLQRLVAEHLREAAAASLAFRPAPLHRLDRGTSGIVICAATLHGARRFSELLRTGRIGKWYIALLGCRLSAPAHWRDHLVRDPASGLTRVARAEDGRGAPAKLTVFPLLHTGRSEISLAAIRLETGRRHQIRAQAAARGCTLAGDRRYGSPGRTPYLLHAIRIELAGDTELLGRPIVTAPLPPEAAARLERLFGSGSAGAVTELFSPGQLAPHDLTAFASAHRLQPENSPPQSPGP